MNNLLDILKGCLYSNTVHQAESRLKQEAERPTFLQELLVLIPGQEPQVLAMILSTVKNYILAHWNPPPQNNTFFIPQDQKKIIMDNILNLYYEISHNQQAVNLYKNIVSMIILVDYPWQGIDQQLSNDLNGSVFASVIFCRQIARNYEYSSDQTQRSKAQYFATNYFPKLENLVEQILTNFNDQTSKLLYIILKTFFSTIHCDLPEYFKNQDNFVKWFVYVKTLLNAQLQNNIMNQRISARILSRIVSQYMNQELDSKKLKGWSESLISRIGQDATNTVFSCLSNPNGDEETASHILSAIMGYASNEKLRFFLNQQNFQFILYDRLLPNMESTPSELDLFQKDPIEYIRRDDDLTSDAFKRNAADTVERLLYHCSFGPKSELMKFIEYTASSLQSTQVTDRHKEVLIRQLTKMSIILKKNQFIKQQFEYLTNTFFLPLLKIDSPLLNAEVCRFFAAYLDDLKLSEGTVNELMGSIYEKMIGKYLVLKYNAILAFTSLLSQESALRSAKQHFQSILEIYVKMLDELDHENLLKCLERIVSNFSNEIVTVAPNLISHLISKFYSTYNAQATEEDQEEDSNKQASASLSTITEILQCPLSDELYYQASEQIIPMIKQIFDELQDYFSEVLTLINVLVYKAKSVVDMQTLYVICRKLLEGKDCNILTNQIDYNTVNLLNKITESSDTQYEANLISIVKNLIQKLPDNILHKYPYPIHSELILALIQNNRLSLNQIGQLNTNLVDGIWAQYLQSYKAIVYGEGQVTNPQSLKSITGVSLYPWLLNYFDVHLVKILLSQICGEEQENQDDYYEENTMQMLEKYANEDDDEQACDQYYGTEGVNYTYFYDSPYNSSKDREMFELKLKSLSNEEASTLMNQLSNKDQKRLQTLFN